MKYAKVVRNYSGIDGIEGPLQQVLDEVMANAGEILPGFPKIVEMTREKIPTGIFPRGL